LEAFGAVVRAGLPHRLVIVGPTGWGGREELWGRAAGLGSRVLVAGKVSDDQLGALYRGADLFALPSLHEGFGLPVLEAMAQSTAVVCSDIAALREVAGTAAELVDPGDRDAWELALVGLLGDDAARARLVTAGQGRVRQFSWSRCIEETRSVYREVAP
jgi:alpha-1,3-rhamnosyl/mannosyltransferase